MRAVPVLVALGCNLPDATGRSPLDTCRWAVGRLGERTGLSLAAVSRWYRTRPVPPSGQPDFINGAVLLRGVVDPFMLLKQLHTLEAEAGRVRSVPNAARPLDLDLIAVDDLIIHTDDITLPHPRMQERGFVLAPLADIAPDWRHPVLGKTVREMLQCSDRTGVEALPCADGGDAAVKNLATSGPSA